MGGVRITNDGLQVQDTAEFLNTVYVDSIAADKQVWGIKYIRMQSSLYERY